MSVLSKKTTKIATTIFLNMKNTLKFLLKIAFKISPSYKLPKNRISTSLATQFNIQIIYLILPYLSLEIYSFSGVGKPVLRIEINHTMHNT